MEEVKFSLSEIDKTFARYKKDDIYDGVVVLKRNDGVIFNIGGKSDAFIDKNDFENFDAVKVGDRFKVAILGEKTEEGMICVSKKIADQIIIGSTTAEKLRFGSQVSFYVTSIKDGDLVSKLGVYDLIVPHDEIDIRPRHLGYYLNKQLTGIVTEINRDDKQIVCSVKMLKEQLKESLENQFWSSIFINKVVDGTVEKIMPYGAFVNVDGISCFIHISDIAYERVENIEDYLKVGQTYKFRVIKIDKLNKRVSLGLKQLSENPRKTLLKKLKVGDIYTGTVVKILAFGAIVKLNDVDISGLLHVSDATTSNDKRIYEIVKLGQKIEVEIKQIDIEKDRISFKLYNN